MLLSSPSTLSSCEFSRRLKIVARRPDSISRDADSHKRAAPDHDVTMRYNLSLFDDPGQLPVISKRDGLIDAVFVELSLSDSDSVSVGGVRQYSHIT